MPKAGNERVEPQGVDPNNWTKFVENESAQKKIEQNIKNAENRKKLEYSHCLGRRTYAQKGYLMVRIIIKFFLILIVALKQNFET